MNIKEIQTKSGKTLPLLFGDDGKVISEVYKYMRFLITNGNSYNTVISYCQRLKLYYEWLEVASLTYKTAVESKSATNKGIIENFIAFKLWLKYPDYNKNVVSINGYTAIRTSKTVNLIMSTVLSFYDFISLDEGIDKLPVYRQMRGNAQFHSFLSEMTIKNQRGLTSVLKEKEVKKRLEYITREEYEKCYENATSLRNKIIIGLLFECGMRVSEVIGLMIEDLKDIQNKTIHIVKHNDPTNKDAAVKYDSEGTVFITDRLQKDIIEYINNFLVDIDTNYFIVNQYGDNKYQPMSRRNIEDMITRLGRKIGINDLHPHSFRHGLAMDMLNSGCNMVQIKDTLRHSNINTTSDIYARYDTATKRQMMDEYNENANKNFAKEGSTLDELVDFLLEDDKEDE